MILQVQRRQQHTSFTNNLSKPFKQSFSWRRSPKYLLILLRLAYVHSRLHTVKMLSLGSSSTTSNLLKYSQELSTLARPLPVLLALQISGNHHQHSCSANQGCLLVAFFRVNQDSTSTSSSRLRILPTIKQSRLLDPF